MSSPRQVQFALEALRAGRAVVFPTDTVYGLGVAVRYADSPRELYDLKRRDTGKPVAWLVGGPGDLDRFGAEVPEEARRRVSAQWPGVLTVVVKASPEVPAAYRSPGGTIGLRMPASDLVLSLIAEVGPLATTSANVAGEGPVRRLVDLSPDIALRAAAVIQDDEAGRGVPSTVLDFSQGKETTLRD